MMTSRSLASSNSLSASKRAVLTALDIELEEVERCETVLGRERVERDGANDLAIELGRGGNEIPVRVPEAVVGNKPHRLFRVADGDAQGRNRKRPVERDVLEEQREHFPRGFDRPHLPTRPDDPAGENRVQPAVCADVGDAHARTQQSGDQTKLLAFEKRRVEEEFGNVALWPQVGDSSTGKGVGNARAPSMPDRERDVTKEPHGTAQRRMTDARGDTHRATAIA